MCVEVGVAKGPDSRISGKVYYPKDWIVPGRQSWPNKTVRVGSRERLAGPELAVGDNALNNIRRDIHWNQVTQGRLGR